MTAMSEIGLRILAELPYNLGQKIKAALDDDFDIETEDLAEQLVHDLNEGQRWAIAKAAVSAQVDSRRRSMARRREVAATRPAGAGARANEARVARLEERRQRNREHGLPEDAPSGSVAGVVMAKAMEELRQEIRLELTHELLESQFATGDGARVSWGEATIEQHAARAAWLERQATGTAETAVRHHVAVDLLRRSQCNTLAEAKMRGAA